MSDFLDFRLVVSKMSDYNSDMFIAFVADAPVDRTYCCYHQLSDIKEIFNTHSRISIKCDSNKNYLIDSLDIDNQLSDNFWRIGEALFRFLFPENSKIHELFGMSCERAKIKGKYLRLRLELHPSLSELPWEIMRCPIQYERAAEILKAQKSISRYLGDMHLDERFEGKRPSIVIIKANKQLDVTQITESFTLEVDRIVNILKHLPVEYKIIQKTNTQRELGEVICKLEEAGHPVIGLHFIGHGGIDAMGSYFCGNENEELGEQKLYVHQINDALDAANSIRWVIINACFAGSEPVGNPLAGLATSISTLKNVPTVIAYKRAVHTKDAEILSSKFFENVLAKKKPIETVLREIQIQMKNPGGLVILQRSIGGAIQENIDLFDYTNETVKRPDNANKSNINSNSISENGDFQDIKGSGSAELLSHNGEFGDMVCIHAGQFRKGLTLLQINYLLDQFKLSEIPIEEQSARQTLSVEQDSVMTLDAYYIDIYPVTNKQFSKYIQSTGTRTEAEIDGSPDNWRKHAGPGKENHPVVCVSKNDALSYCQWVGKRLPTSDEWIKACRGKAGRIYPWGDKFDVKKCNTAETMIGWETTPVNKYPDGVSEYGCYDMVGNVDEFTGSSDNDGNVIILGGSWSMSCQVYGIPVLRRLAPPNYYSNDLGFRCAK